MLTDVKKILEQLMDETNWEPIEIVNSNGERARFNQIALLPTTVESQEYVDETVEHNFAILHPLDDAGEEIGKPLVIDITIDEDRNYALTVVDDPLLIGEIMAEYREVRGITPDDLAINNEEDNGEDDEDSDDDEEENEDEDEDEEDESSEEDGYCGLAMHILLLLFTFGIWQLIWVYKTTAFLNCVEDEESRDPLTKLLLYLFVPFYSIYWTYKSAQRIDALAESKNIDSDLSIGCLILSIIIPIIPPIVMQGKINEIATAE